MKEKKARFTVEIDVGLHAKMKDIAWAMDTSITRVVETAVREMIERRWREVVVAKARAVAAER